MTADLVLYNSGVFDNSSLVIADYGPTVVNVILGSINTLSSKAVEIEGSFKDLAISGQIRGMAANSKISLKVGEENKNFTLQESMNLVNSYLLPLQQSWQDYKLTESGPTFVLANLENNVQLGLVNASIQVRDLLADIEADAKSQSLIFYLILGAAALVALFTSVWLVLRNWARIEREISLSYGFWIEECITLREGLEHIRLLMVAATDRNRTNETLSIGSASKPDDEAKIIQAGDASVEELKHRKQRGSLARLALQNIALNSAVILAVLGLSCGLVYRFSSNYGVLVDQNVAFNKMIKIGLDQSSRINLVKVFMLNSLFDTTFEFKSESVDPQMKKHSLDNNGESLVNLHKILLENKEFYEVIEGGDFYETLVNDDICKLYDQYKDEYRPLFVTSSDQPTDNWFLQSCQELVNSIMEDNQLNKGINGFVTRLNTYISRIQEAIYLVTKEQISPPFESQCPDLPLIVKSNREKKAKCLVSTKRFQNAGNSHLFRLSAKHSAADLARPALRQIEQRDLRRHEQHFNA